MANAALESVNSKPASRRRILGAKIPAEGENGLFSQSWFPICLSSDIPEAAVKGYDFLDGEVVAYRGDDGIARVMSAYCPHVGANLATGKVVGNRLQCAFHLWEMGSDGYVEKVGSGDPVPKQACIFTFPTRELYGVIWAFNGEKPTFELPEFPEFANGLHYEAELLPLDFPVDPWAIAAQTPDIQHVRLLHQFEFVTDIDSIPGNVEWTEHSMFYSLHAKAKGQDFNVRAGILGTSVFFQAGHLNGRWFGFYTGFGMPRPAMTKTFAILAVEKSGNIEEDRAFLAYARDLEISIAAEDLELARTIRYVQGALTQKDAMLGRFLNYVRKFPRVHPSADFIR